jgi:hypothetical protein
LTRAIPAKNIRVDSGERRNRYEDGDLTPSRASGLGREMHAAESERLEAAQDAIEFELGADGLHFRSLERWQQRAIDGS